MNYKARGIVLHTIKYGDSSVIAYLFTDLYGRRSYIVQGIRSRTSRSNKAALLQPMFVIEFEGVQRPKSQMDSIRECRSHILLSSTPFDARKSTISLFMAEVLYRLIREVETNEPLFDFVCSAVENLDRMKDGVANFHLWFLVNLSYYLGFYPGNEYEDGYIFDMQEGIFCREISLHENCMNKECSHLLGKLMEAEPSVLGELKLTRGRRSEFLEYMLSFFGYHFGSLKSTQSIEILRDVF